MEYSHQISPEKSEKYDLTLGNKIRMGLKKLGGGGWYCGSCQALLRTFTFFLINSSDEKCSPHFVSRCQSNLSQQSLGPRPTQAYVHSQYSSWMLLVKAQG